MQGGQRLTALFANRLFTRRASRGRQGLLQLGDQILEIARLRRQRLGARALGVERLFTLGLLFLVPVFNLFLLSFAPVGATLYVLEKSQSLRTCAV